MRIPILAAVLISASASVCLAHDSWVMCTPPNVRSGGEVALHITSGTAFPKLETAPEASRVKSVGWRIGGRQGSLTVFDAEKESLVAKGRVNTDGVAVVYAEFNPKEIDLEPGKVEEYMDEIGAPESVRRAWKADGSGKFHETFVKHAKTYLRVGDSGDAKGCLGPLGLNIDFLPDRDPTSLKVGDTLTIKAIRGGNEMESFAVGTVSGSGTAKLQRTNRAGMVSIDIDSSGWWLVRGTELRHNSDGTWQSDWTTLTFFVEK